MDRTQDISTSSSGLGLIPSTNVYDYSNNSINKQDTVIDFNEDAGHVTCPEGWMGPDEKGECWKLQILS